MISFISASSKQIIILMANSVAMKTERTSDPNSRDETSDTTGDAKKTCG
jgi:hypothetical protein